MGTDSGFGIGPRSADWKAAEPCQGLRSRNKRFVRWCAHRGHVTPKAERTRRPSPGLKWEGWGEEWRQLGEAEQGRSRRGRRRKEGVQSFGLKGHVRGLMAQPAEGAGQSSPMPQKNGGGTGTRGIGV